MVDSGGFRSTGVEFRCSIVVCSCCSLKAWGGFDWFDGCEDSDTEERGGAWSLFSESGRLNQIFSRCWWRVLVVSRQHQSLLLLWTPRSTCLLAGLVLKEFVPFVPSGLSCIYPIMGFRFSPAFIVGRD